MSKTVVGLFSSMQQAEQVKQALIAKGYNAHVVANESGMDTTSNTSGEGVGQKISNFFHGLTGGDNDVHEHYAAGVNSGGALVGVKCEDEDASAVASLLKQQGAQEIEGETTPPSEAQYVAPAGAETGQTAIPIVEEQLTVGKREVDRGGVRVYSHVVEQPATADVTLRDERIVVERRPVNRVATAADFNMGQGSPVELRASGEEAVVGKTAKVVEEVLVGKASSSHTEVIHDSVRKTEVEMEEIVPGAVSQKNRL